MIFVVVSTIGIRENEFLRLLQNINHQVSRDGLASKVGVSVALQGRADSEFLRKSVYDHLPNVDEVHVVSSERGLSKGRNDAIRACNAPLGFLFLNDTSRLKPGTLQFLASCAEQFDVVAFPYLENGEPRYKLPQELTSLDMFSVWKVLEPAMYIRFGVVSAVEGFNETVGTGSRFYPQSGEGTELLLKAMKAFGSLTVRWVQQSEGFAVIGVTQDDGLTSSEDRRKRFFYGVGYGRILRLYRYPFWYVAKHLVGPIVRGVFSGRGISACLGEANTVAGRSIGFFMPRVWHRRMESK